MLNAPNIEDRLNTIMQDEVERLLKQYEGHIDDYFMLDVDGVVKKIGMSKSAFYKYMRNEPEIVAVEHYPVDPKTHIRSKKPFWKPDELKEAINRLIDRWDREV